MATIQNFTGANEGRWMWDGMNYTNHNPDKSYSLTKVAEDTIRFEIRGGESWPGDAENLNRSDTVAFNQTDWFLKDRDVVSTFRMMIEPGARNSASWLLLVQAHPNQNTGSPPLALVLTQNNRLAVEVRDSAQQWKNIWTASAEVVRGKWYDVRLEMRFGSAGHARISIDGVQVRDYSGSIGYTSAIWWAFGPYRAAAPETFAVQIQDMIIRYAELLPEPQPIPEPEPEPEPIPEPVPAQPIRLKITVGTGVREAPSMWSASYSYMKKGQVVLAEALVDSIDPPGKEAFPAIFARVGEFTYFAVHYRGKEYAVEI